MSETQRKYLIRAAVFAIVYGFVMMLIAVLAGADVSTTGATTTFKMTFTVGLPSLDQLLDPQHQFTFSASWHDPLFLFWMAFVTCIYAWANGFFIALLARSTGELHGTPLQNANRAFLKLLFWTIAQMGITLLCMPLMLLHLIGGILSMFLLLWFRYTFMFYEYTVVVNGTGFVEALDECRQIRLAVRDEASKYFVGIVVFNIFVALLVNGLFSVGAILFFLPLNAILMTLTQHNLLRIFNRATG